MIIEKFRLDKILGVWSTRGCKTVEKEIIKFYIKTSEKTH